MEQATLNAALAIYASNLAASSPYFNGLMATMSGQQQMAFVGPTSTPPFVLTPPNSGGNGSFFSPATNGVIPAGNSYNGGLQTSFPFNGLYHPLMNPTQFLPLAALNNQVLLGNADITMEDLLKKIQNTVYLQQQQHLMQNCSPPLPCTNFQYVTPSPSRPNSSSNCTPKQQQSTLHRQSSTNLHQQYRKDQESPSPQLDAINSDGMTSSVCSNLATLAEVASHLIPETSPTSQITSKQTNRNARSTPTTNCVRPILTNHSAFTTCNNSNALTSSPPAPAVTNSNTAVMTSSWTTLASQLLAAAELQDELRNGGSHVEIKQMDTVRNESFIDNIIDQCANGSRKTASCAMPAVKDIKRKRRNATPTSVPQLMRIEDTINNVIRLQNYYVSVSTQKSSTSSTTVNLTNIATPIGNEILDLSIKKRRSCGDDDSFNNCTAESRPCSSSPMNARDRTSHVVTPIVKDHVTTKRCVNNKIDSYARINDPSKHCKHASQEVVSSHHQMKNGGTRRLTRNGNGTHDRILPNYCVAPWNQVGYQAMNETSAPINTGGARRLVDCDAARLPLRKNWRRQTCVRGVSASGVRGDVLYYSPCNRKFTSIAEIARYLKKHNDKDLCIDYFTFSSKVIAGDYFIASPDGMKSSSEEEIRSLLGNIRQTNGINSATFSVTKHASRQNFSSMLLHNKTKDLGECKVKVDEEIEENVAYCLIDLINKVCLFCN